MFSFNKKQKNNDKYEQLKKLINEADAILIGAGAGLSTSAGLTYSGERFEKYFSEFIKKYGFTDMYTAGFYPFKTLEEYWAYWSRHIYYNRYESEINDTYQNLFNLVKNKNYFVLTTNVDHKFQDAGFDESKLFFTQGDYGLWQCSVPCHYKTYENKETVYKMINEQKDCKIPTTLIPHCPKCNAPMTMNLRIDNTFVQDGNWYKNYENYKNFLKNYGNKKILFLELGVGTNTPVIIKIPFWKMTFTNENSNYVCINFNEAICPDDIKNRSLLFQEDVNDVLKKIGENFLNKKITT